MHDRRPHAFETKAQLKNCSTEKGGLDPMHQQHFPTSAACLPSALLILKEKMAGGDQQRQALDSNNDPLLGMMFCDPLMVSKSRKEAPKAQQPPAKKAKLSVSSSAAAPAKERKRSPDITISPAVKHGSLLHQSCRLFHQCAPVLSSALEMEGPETACTRAKSATSVNPAAGGMSNAYLVGDGREPYSLPINILLHHDACLEAIQVVARAAPKALIMKDGRDENCSLIIALRMCGGRSLLVARNEEDPSEGASSVSASATSLAEELLAINPEAAQMADKRRNFPLHVAAYVGASFSAINKLYYAYPEALLETNFHGESPLDIAIRNGKCSELSTNFLQEKMDHLKTARLRALQR
jgi:Ankyrin repeats (many copies)